MSYKPNNLAYVLLFELDKDIFDWADSGAAREKIPVIMGVTVQNNREIKA